MNILVPLIIIAVLLVYIGFRWNNIRTKMAFFLMLFGVLFLLFFAFLLFTGSSFNFSVINDVASSLKVYALWIKTAAVNVFKTTGKIIGATGI